jgi:hypothetical protein
MVAIVVTYHHRLCEDMVGPMVVVEHAASAEEFSGFGSE